MAPVPLGYAHFWIPKNEQGKIETKTFISSAATRKTNQENRDEFFIEKIIRLKILLTSFSNAQRWRGNPKKITWVL